MSSGWELLIDCIGVGLMVGIPFFLVIVAVGVVDWLDRA